ncbi:U-box domain-containing protein 52 [Phtheirospermum japonicum]|uniref:RING-type E3 ubiquitin transferase n=1 Tax=Phtheirospermum japonicum TaxID=374723 RepID=A0A830BUE1_9LAMI|nr:U-box domain-containing protein 52 [Phtheirospermum japonicum]
MANQEGGNSPDQEGRNSSTAVAIDRDKNSQFAVRWAVENLWLKDKTIILVHVISTQRSLHPQDGEPRAPTHTELQQLFLPYRGFCARKGIRATEVILHDLDIASALSEFVSANSIKTIVLGASSRSAIARAFRNADVPTSVGKSAPDSCTVYAISKGRTLKIKSASENVSESSSKPSPDNSTAGSPGFGRIQSRQCFDYNNNNSQSRRSPDNSQSTTTNSPLASSTNNNSIRERSNTPSPPNSFSSNEPMHMFAWEKRGKNLTPDASLDSTPFTSNGNSPEHKARNFALQQSSNYMNLRGRTLENLPQFSSESSDHSEGQSFQSDLSYDLLDQPRISDASRSSTASAAELEDELRRMKSELKQILEMYTVACQEAENARGKVRDIVQWETEKTSRLAEAKQGQESAFAIIEREKQKCKAAVDIAHKAQRIAELESEKRKRAERKYKHESEEKQKAIDAYTLVRNVVRYRRYSIEEIEAATNNFADSDKIGEGGYGPVFKGTIDHTPVAVKVLRSEISEGQKQFQREVEVLSRMRHPNMVILLGACPEFGCLVYEYMENGCLESRLFRHHDTPPLPWPSRFRIAAEIATALNFLHQTKPEPLVHRDLKPANILLDKNFTSKISDVGLSRLVPPSIADTVTQYRMTAAAGTFCYIDPEYQQTGMLGTKSDIYSLGVLLLQIITAKPPMGLTHVVESAIERGEFEGVLDPEVKDWPVEEAMAFARLALRCCELRRRDRPDMEAVILPELERLRDVGYRVSPPPRFYNYMLLVGDVEPGSEFSGELTSSSQVRLCFLFFFVFFLCVCV